MRVPWGAIMQCSLQGPLPLIAPAGGPATARLSMCVKTAKELLASTTSLPTRACGLSLTDVRMNDRCQPITESSAGTPHLSPLLLLLFHHTRKMHGSRLLHHQEAPQPQPTCRTAPAAGSPQQSEHGPPAGSRKQRTRQFCLHACANPRPVLHHWPRSCALSRVLIL